MRALTSGRISDACYGTDGRAQCAGSRASRASRLPCRYERDRSRLDNPDDLLLVLVAVFIEVELAERMSEIEPAVEVESEQSVDDGVELRSDLELPNDTETCAGV